MSNVVPFQSKAPVLTNEPNEARKPFSFDITQTDQRGMVLLDACVPVTMATAFLEMLIAFEGGGATVASL